MSYEQNNFTNPVVYSTDIDTELYEYLKNFDADDFIEQFNDNQNHTVSDNHNNNNSNNNLLGSSLTSELFSDLEETQSINNKQDDTICNYDYNAGYPLLCPLYFESQIHTSTGSIELANYDQINKNVDFSTMIACSSSSLADVDKQQKQQQLPQLPQQPQQLQQLQQLQQPKSTTNDAPIKRRRRRRKQSEPKSFLCPFDGCNNVYFRSSHLKVHVRKHTGEKPFRCTWPGCEWSFRRSDELSRHKRCHSGVKPYACEFCLKCFGRSDHLSKHMKVHQRSQNSLANQS